MGMAKRTGTEVTRRGRELIPLADAARKLREPHNRAYNRLLAGLLDGQRLGTRWYVTAASLRRALAADGR